MAVAVYRSRRVDSWRKIKCWTESALVLIGTDIDKRSGSLIALLARQGEEGLSWIGWRSQFGDHPQDFGEQHLLHVLTAVRGAFEISGAR